MGAPDIAWLVMLSFALAFVLYMRIRFPSPSKIEETAARVAAVAIFLLLAYLFLSPPESCQVPRLKGITHSRGPR
jgi:hypothetical protein